MTIGTQRMMNLINSSLLRRLTAVSFGVSLFTAAIAHADSSCTTQLQTKIEYLQQRGGFYYIDMSMHREDVSWVSYSFGTISLDGPRTGLLGNANQIFSDRWAGSQPFNINQADVLSLDLSPTGFLHIQSITWGFDTYWDMSCQGDLVTKYFPGFGTITLAFRGWSIIR